MILAAYIIGLTIALLTWPDVERDVADGIWAWTCAFTLFLLFRDRRKAAVAAGDNPVIAIAPLILGWIFIRYGLGALGVYYWDQYTWTMPGLERHWHVHGGRLNLNEACKLSMLAAIGFYIAFRIPVTRIVNWLPDMGWTVDLARLKLNTLIYIPIGLFITLYVGPRAPLTINFLVSMFGMATYALIVMAAYWWFSGTGLERTKWMFVTLATCAIASTLALTSGQVGQVFVPCMMVFLGYAVVYGTLPWRILVPSILAALAVVGPALTAYKHVSYNIASPETPVQDRLRYTAEYLSTIRLRGGIELAVQRFVGRMILIEFPAAFALRYPESFDYLRGRSFAIEFGSLIPRLVWPEKPDMNIEINRYSQGVGLISAGGTTSAKFDAVAEYYVNFGPLGVVILSIIHGLYLKVLYEWFTTTLEWLTGISLHLLLFLLNFDFFGIGQIFVMHVKLVPVCIFILYLLGRRDTSTMAVRGALYATKA